MPDKIRGHFYIKQQSQTLQIMSIVTMRPAAKINVPYVYAWCRLTVHRAGNKPGTMAETYLLALVLSYQ